MATEPGLGKYVFQADSCRRFAAPLGTVQADDERPVAIARKHPHLMIDFGRAIGLRKNAAQITERYTPEDLIGRRVIAVVNFPPRQIGPVRSEVLILGFADQSGAIALAATDEDIPDRARLA